MPGTAEPATPVTDDPPSLSTLVMARVAWEPRVSESEAVTRVASDAEAAAVLTYVAPVAPEGTVPCSSSVTDCPAGSEDRVQVSVAKLKTTPLGTFGLVTFENPWVGRVSTTLTFEASLGPVSVTTIV